LEKAVTVKRLKVNQMALKCYIYVLKICLEKLFGRKDSVVKKRQISTDRYTLEIKQIKVFQSEIEIKDSIKMEFGSEESALNYVSRNIHKGYTWKVIDPLGNVITSSERMLEF